MSEWRPVPGFEGRYEVSDDGRVRSFHRGWEGRPLAAYVDGWGYLRLHLFDGDGSCRQYSVHELVALAFIGPRPGGRILRHLDGDPQHNVPSNLAYGTPAENAADTVRMGRTLRGADRPTAKLSEADVHQIRRMYRPGGPATMAMIAEIFGLTRAGVRAVLLGRTWAWLVTPGWSPLVGDMRSERHRKVTFGLAGSGRES